METRQHNDHHRPLPKRRNGVAAPLGALLTAVVLLTAPVNPDTPNATQRPVPALSGGIQVNEPDHDAWIQAVRAAGLDSVQVTLYARQLAWDSSDMILPEEAAAVVSEIRAAHNAGLGVILVLRTALEHGLAENRHLWHGMIWPSDDALGEWFARYREFLLFGARLAEQESVELLAIGSELNSMTSTLPLTELPDLYAYFLDPQRTAAVRERLVECAATVDAAGLEPDLHYRDGTVYDSLDALLRTEEEVNRRWTRTITGGARSKSDIAVLNRRRTRLDRGWRQLIAEARALYRGPLTYAANFDQVEQVGFWDALDAIGVNAYYPLSTLGLGAEALADEMHRRWGRIAAALEDLAAEAGSAGQSLPVLLLELGWTTKEGSTVRPYSYHRVEVLETSAVGSDGEEQLTCVHWATQQDAPDERIRALAALRDTVRAGEFPSLRGFTLWKLTTRPVHRDIEPFAVVLATPMPAPQALPAPVVAASSSAPGTGAGAAARANGSAKLPATPALPRQRDAADRIYVGIAAELAADLAANVYQLGQRGRPAPGSRRLVELPARFRQEQEQELDGQLTLGRDVYAEQCMSCHGREGKGDGPAARFLETQPRDFTSGEWNYAEEDTVEGLSAVIREGIDDSGMTPFEEVLTEAQIEAVARYVLEVLATPELPAR